MKTKTIAAIATPIGIGAVAMIRLSGPQSLAIAQSMFSKSIQNTPSHRLVHGNLFSKNQEVLDSVLLGVFRAPHSFTGEDSIEIYCHGSLLIQKKILKRLIELGADHAEPGEFSYRAFLNGKIDLAQAEAIQDLILAKNEAALQSAQEQLKGALSKKITSLQKALIEIAAVIDAWVDYPEEGLEFQTEEELLESLQAVLAQVRDLKNRFYDGKKLSAEAKLCLIGAPNAGKSSLMNTLLGYDRAIVTPIAGTTRDLLHEELYLSGLHFQLTDTAGIRETEELIEKEGIRRSFEAAKNADLILYVIDVTLMEKELKVFDTTLWDPKKTVLVFNKCDLIHPSFFSHPNYESIAVSAKTDHGIETLKTCIEKKLAERLNFSPEEILVTKERHFEALVECEENLLRVLDGFKNQLSAEFVSFDLRMALKALGKIIGFDLSESILDSIFSKFCVGK